MFCLAVLGYSIITNFAAAWACPAGDADKTASLLHGRLISNGVSQGNEVTCILYEDTRIRRFSLVTCREYQRFDG